jgi:NAD(P)H-flavin reductase
MPQKVHCQVMNILDHGERVYSIILKPDNPAPRFLPGQFLHLALDKYTPGDFWPDSRPFSIASKPSQRELLRITYVVKGNFTMRMESELRPGAEVWVKMPYGEFIISSEEDVCLLAGGTGVTAFTAFLAELGPDHAHPIYLIYGARHPDLLIYRTLIESAAAKCPNLYITFLAEEAKTPGLFTGRINLDQIWQILPDPLAVKYYLSGPPMMLKTLMDTFVERGMPAGQLYTDVWE